MAPKTKLKRIAQDLLAPSAVKKTKPDPDFSKPAELVTIRVGVEGNDETFIVLKELACYHSPVFEAAFHGQFAEGESQNYRLESTNPRVFRLLVEWLYLQKIELLTSFAIHEDPEETWDPVEVADTKDEINTGDDVDNMADWDLEVYFGELPGFLDEFYLVQLWILADRLLITSLQNAVMKHFDVLWGEFAVPEYEFWFPYLYKHTSDGSLIRHMVVDRVAYNLKAFKRLEETYLYDTLPHQLLLDVFMVLVQGERSSKGNLEVFCKKIWRNYLVPEDE